MKQVFKSVSQIGALCLLFSVDNAEGMKSEQMALIQERIDSLADVFHRAIAEETGDDHSYVQVQSSISNHLGNMYHKYGEIEEFPPQENFLFLDVSIIPLIIIN